MKEGSGSNSNAGANKARNKRRIGSCGENKIIPQLPGSYLQKKTKASEKAAHLWRMA